MANPLELTLGKKNTQRKAFPNRMYNKQTVKTARNHPHVVSSAPSLAFAFRLVATEKRARGSCFLSILRSLGALKQQSCLTRRRGF